MKKLFMISGGWGRNSYSYVQAPFFILNQGGL